VLNWVNDQGVPLGDMKKETLNAILDPDDEFGIEDFSSRYPTTFMKFSRFAARLPLRAFPSFANARMRQRLMTAACGTQRSTTAPAPAVTPAGSSKFRIIPAAKSERGKGSRRMR
jgi:hypothetical protein